MLFDTHAHYDDERFDEDRDALLASMPENNVGLILNPGCDAETSRKAVGYANRYPFVYAAVGLHPENIEDGWTQTLDEIRTLAQSEPRVRAIGEIGLDYYWEKEERARARQQVVFARQMELARELKLPVIVHDRDAHADCMEITRRYPDVIGVYHCYAGHIEMARELLERGYYLSFTGVITFKNADGRNRLALHGARAVPRPPKFVTLCLPNGREDCRDQRNAGRGCRTYHDRKRQTPVRHRMKNFTFLC